ncbi:hypothetical protein [Actinacidiphila sp. bgisy167]
MLLFTVLWWAADQPPAARTALTAHGYRLLGVLSTCVPSAALIAGS